jgi:protein involved in polysaccharide export with SLBB domain
VVRASGLMRLSIQGQVGSPGFYVVPAESLVSEALMVAGGPASQADLDALRIERGSDRLMDGEELQEAMRDGRTLDQLNLQAGDQIVLPAARSGAGIWGAVLRYGLIVASTVLLGVRIAG